MFTFKSLYFGLYCVFPGENVVRGDKESIENLLEIFDGLLEYLKEEISEESQNDGRQIILTHFLIFLRDDNAFFNCFFYQRHIQTYKKKMCFLTCKNIHVSLMEPESESSLSSVQC